MKTIQKKLMAMLLSVAATACVGVGGVFAFSHTAQATAEVTLENEFDFVTVKGRCSPFKEKTEALEIEYPGSVYAEFEFTFNNEGE